MVKTTFASVAVIMLTVIPAIMHGSHLNRWGSPPDLTLAANQLLHFPRQIGQWHCSSDEKQLGDAACRELGLVDHFNRNYVHRETGDTINVLLMVGQPGPLVRHPPSMCYANRANQQVGDAMSIKIGNNPNAHCFKVLQFKRTILPSPTPFFVAYAHTADGTWKSPVSPRLEFGGESKLYKVQALADATTEDSLDRLKGFLDEFVQVFQMVLDEDSPVTKEE